MFLCSGGGTKTKHYIFGKNVRSLRTLFFLENTAVFSEQSGERTSGASGTAKRRSNACKAVGRSVAKAGGAMPRTSGASGERREASESETTEPRASERSERAFTDLVQRPATRAERSAASL